MDETSEIIVNLDNQELTIEEIIIQYRRGEKNSTPDNIVINLCDVFIEKINKNVDYNTSKADFIKIIDNLIYLFIHSLSFTIFVLGLYNGSTNINSSSNIESTSKWFFISSVLAGISSILSEISKKYNFNLRSVEIYKCVQEMNLYILELEKLKISPENPDEKLDKLKNIEIQLQPIMMRIFTNQITNEKQRKITMIKHQYDK